MRNQRTYKVVYRWDDSEDSVKIFEPGNAKCSAIIIAKSSDIKLAEDIQKILQEIDVASLEQLQQYSKEVKAALQKLSVDAKIAGSWHPPSMGTVYKALEEIVLDKDASEALQKLKLLKTAYSVVKDQQGLGDFFSNINHDRMPQILLVVEDLENALTKIKDNRFLGQLPRIFADHEKDYSFFNVLAKALKEGARISVLQEGRQFLAGDDQEKSIDRSPEAVAAEGAAQSAVVPKVEKAAAI
jgi:hypothetical protein